MEQYNESISKIAGVKLIHVSFDRDEDSANDWAKQAGFPWLTILHEDVDRSALVEPYFGDSLGVPSYLLVDHEGNQLAKGKSAVMAYLGKLNE